MFFEAKSLKIRKISKNGQRKKWLRGTGIEGEIIEKDLQM